MPSSEWTYFQPDERNMSIHGMERILDDGTALDVLAYGTMEEPNEFSWMLRLWDDYEQRYSIIASYDEGLYFDTIEEAYDDLAAMLEEDYPHLIQQDEITHDPQGAKARFLSKLVAIGLAASLAVSALAGCAGAAAYAGQTEFDDVPLGTSRMTEVTYSSLLSSDIDLEEYDAYVSIMSSGENPEVADDYVTGWYDGDFEYEDLSIEVLNYAAYDNPLYSLYKTGCDSGIAVTHNAANGDIRIKSNAVSDGDDFNAMYDEVDRIARSIDSTAARNANGSTAEYVRLVATDIAESIQYVSPNSDAHSNDIYGALIEGQSACYGFASAVKYVLDMQGIPNFIATGEKLGGRHAWNMVDIGGTWLVVDATACRSLMNEQGTSALADCADSDAFILSTLDTLDDLGAGYSPSSDSYALMRM